MLICQCLGWCCVASVKLPELIAGTSLSKDDGAVLTAGLQAVLKYATSYHYTS